MLSACFCSYLMEFSKLDFSFLPTPIRFNDNDQQSTRKTHTHAYTKFRMSSTQHSTSSLAEVYTRRKKHWVKPFIAFARTLLIFKNATAKSRVYWFHCRCFSSGYSLWSLAITSCVPLFTAFFSVRTILCTIFSNIPLLFILFASLLPLFLVKWFFLFFPLFVHSNILYFEARSHVSTKRICFFPPFPLAQTNILVKRSALRHQYDSCFAVSVARSYSFLFALCDASFITFSLASFFFMCALYLEFLSFCIHFMITFSWDSTTETKEKWNRYTHEVVWINWISFKLDEYKGKWNTEYGSRFSHVTLSKIFSFAFLLLSLPWWTSAERDRGDESISSYIYKEMKNW